MAYGRLPSRPVLLATSSAVLPTGPRYMKTIGRHPIVGLWSSDLPLPARIIQHLRGINWLAIDVVRLGYPTKDFYPPTHGLSVVLLITIAPGSTTNAEDLFDTACTCKATLNFYELNDVEVEIKQSEAMKPLSEETAHPKYHQSWQTPQLYSGSLDVFGELHLGNNQPLAQHLAQLRHLCDSIGTRFSHEDEQCTGTKGLLLDIREPASLAGPAVLTCRHVFFHGRSDTGTAYRWPGPSGQAHRVIQDTGASNDTHTDVNETLVEQNRREVQLEEHLYLGNPDPKRTILLQRWAQIGRARADMAQRAKRILDASHGNTIVVGHVGFAQELSLGRWSPPYQWPWLRDYALVMLHDEVHSRRPANRLPLTFEELQKRLLEYPTRDLTLAELELLSAFRERSIDDEASLCGEIISTEEVMTFTSLPGDERKMVGKIGAATGLTFGCVNEVKSVLRQTAITEVSWEICIVNPLQGAHEAVYNTAFSSRRDSGAAVWDFGSRVLGMVTGGFGNENVLDITYVTSIHNILADLREDGIIAEVL